MNVKISEYSKKILTVAELPYAKQIVQDMKEYSTQLKELAELASRAYLSATRKDDFFCEVLKAEAEIVRDNGIQWDFFGEGCGHLGVWVKFTAGTYDGYIKGECLLSDIWEMDGTDETNEAVVNHGWFRYYVEQE